ncbi:MAG: anti-sigma factor [Candidatus Velthaea sp.]|jgi:anti-sigma-K factor RskA
MNDTPDRETMLDLVAAYALGVLPRSEQALVTAYILADSQARAEYEALRPVADLVGLAADEPVDSARTARMKQRLLATVNAPAAAAAARPDMARPDVPRPGTARFAPVRRNGSERSSWFIGAGLAAAAAVVFALVSTIQNFSLRSDLANANSRAASLQAQIAQNERVRIRDREMVGDLIATDAQRFAVPQGEVIKRGSHVYLTLHSLPALPHGKVFQAWTIAKGGKTLAPSIVFTPSPAGNAVVALPENAENLAVVALSIEPEGGSKAPTSKALFVRPLT